MESNILDKEINQSIQIFMTKMELLNKIVLFLGYNDLIQLLNRPKTIEEKQKKFLEIFKREKTKEVEKMSLKKSKINIRNNWKNSKRLWKNLKNKRNYR